MEMRKHIHTWENTSIGHPSDRGQCVCVNMFQREVGELKGIDTIWKQYSRKLDDIWGWKQSKNIDKGIDYISGVITDHSIL